MSMSEYIFEVIGDKDENFSDAICAICDNGGELICCEGKCLRAFHASVDAGIYSACDSLELSVKLIKEGTFKCENCRYNQHQCYVCGKLGSSDKSSGAEVFQCGACTCGYFYHPSCVANALRFMYEDEPKDVEAEISSGKPFICPLHFCYTCKQKEQDNETSVLMQFAVCRRCPMAYHRQCLPRAITFEDDEDDGILARAWDDLIPNKIVIYCMKHMIDEELETPLRDHLKFPNTKLKKEKQVKESGADFPTQKLFKEGQLEKTSLRHRRSSGLYSLREPKSRYASKTTLQKKSSSVSHGDCSGVYSFRDRKLVTKYKMVSLLAALENNSSSGKNMDVRDSVGSENQRKSSTDVEASGTSDAEKQSKSFKDVVACNDDSVLSNKLENQESSCSEKKMKREKVAAGDSEKRRISSIVVEASGSSGSKKQNEGVEKVVGACSNVYVDSKLENQEGYGSEKKQKSSEKVAAACENDSLATKSENRHSFGSSKKQRKIIKEVSPVAIVLYAPGDSEDSGSEKHVEKLGDSKDFKASKFKNHVKLLCSEKTSKSSKDVKINQKSEENKPEIREKSSRKEDDENRSYNSNSMNSSSSSMDEAKSCSKSTFKPLDFFSGPYCPPSEYSSIGWLTD